MSNIYTEHARLYFCPDVTITQQDIEALIERILDERGSYWVPVWYELNAPHYVDLQYGSGKSATLFNLDADDMAPFEEAWVRLANEGSDDDIIYHWTPTLGETPYEGSSPRRSCVYAFDAMNVALRQGQRRAFFPEGLSWEKTAHGFYVAYQGKYLALNERADMEIGPGARLGSERRTIGGFPTPSTPSHGDREPTFQDVPEKIVRFIKDGQNAIEHIDLMYRGRIVHRAEWASRSDDPDQTLWQHRCADHWDNCVDEEFVRLRGA